MCTEHHNPSDTRSFLDVAKQSYVYLSLYICVMTQTHVLFMSLEQMSIWALSTIGTVANGQRWDPTAGTITLVIRELRFSIHNNSKALMQIRELNL